MKLSDMPIRDFYALEIIKGIVARGQAHHPTTQVAQAYDVADTLLKFQNRAISESDHKIAELTQRAIKAERTLEVLRPVWANDINGRATSNMLAEIYGMLGATTKPAVMQRIRELLQGERNG